VKKLLLIALVALVAVTGGVFAYSFTTATATIGVTAPDSDYATVTAGNATAPTVFGRYSSTWPTSTLFTITPADGYPGDLVVTVSLLNAGALSRYYHHCNMTFQLVDSANQTADEQGIIQVLNMQNAEILFMWTNGTGTAPYRVELTGGSYRLHPWKPLTGGSVQPQLWCEVTAR